ncbi:hypothetical protein TNCV_1043231 [Trichonephila clavipes]|nr:hypothetical protein TNCV_1043231 [Trichonephila clavipes]
MKGAREFRESRAPMGPTGLGAPNKSVNDHPLVFLLRLRTSIPPPTSYHHSIYYVTPVNQSGRCLLPIMVSPLHQATFTFRAMGRRNALRSMSR